MTKLTDAQLIVLSSACRNEDGLATRPENLKTAAAEKLAASLQGKGLVREIRCRPGAPVWREDGQGKTYSLKILKAGREAIGMQEEAGDAAPSVTAQPDVEAEPDARIRHTKNEATPTPVDPGTRAVSKRALIITLLQRAEGATLNDLIAATGWLPHTTTRAALTGLRKTGLTIERSRPEQSAVSFYRIIPSEARPNCRSR